MSGERELGRAALRANVRPASATSSHEPPRPNRRVAAFPGTRLTGESYGRSP